MTTTPGISTASQREGVGPGRSITTIIIIITIITIITIIIIINVICTITIIDHH
jgi:hypothetical protein